jgi:hypothetical protein
MLQIRTPLACLVLLLSSISMSSVQENCVQFSHSATWSVSSHNTSSHSFVRLFLSPGPKNRCWAVLLKKEPPVPVLILYRKKRFLGCEFELSFFYLKRKKKENLWFWFSFFNKKFDVLRVQVWAQFFPSCYFDFDTFQLNSRTSGSRLSSESGARLIPCRHYTLLYATYCLDINF